MITQNPLQHRNQKFEVSLGHITVTVEGNSLEEAVRAARLRICEELPRMWDIVHQLGRDRFKIKAVA